jgi:hypothetical protein
LVVVDDNLAFEDVPLAPIRGACLSSNEDGCGGAVPKLLLF